MGKVSLRRARSGDGDFLFRVYASTRTEELAVLPWTDEQKDAFLLMQFRAQTCGYERQFPDLERAVVLDGGVPAGRLLVVRRETEIRIVDLSLLPGHRGCGIGTTLIDRLKLEARDAQLPLLLHVEVFNPARRLYERLGFRAINDGDVYLEMEWRAPIAKAPVEMTGSAKGHRT